MNEPYAVYYCNNLLNFALYYITNMTQTIFETLDIDRCTKTKYRTTMCKVGVATAFSAVNKLISILKEYFYFGVFPTFSPDFYNTFKMTGVFQI